MMQIFFGDECDNDLMAMYYRLTAIDFQVGRWQGVDERIDGVWSRPM
jgi:hypothetical protein